MKPIGIYHQIDLQALDLAATLRAKHAEGQLVTTELARLARELGITERTADKRTRASRKAWTAGSPTVERAAQLFLGASQEDQLALHMAVLFRAYPFIYHVAEQVGTARRLGSQIRQATIRDRLIRRYGHGPNVHQAVQKVLQSFVSWDLLEKTNERGVYKPVAPRTVTPAVAEVLLAAVLEAGERDALPTETASTHPALFGLQIPSWTLPEGHLLRRFAEGTNGNFFELMGP